MATVDTTPIWHWVVRYRYRIFRYSMKTLSWSICFNTREEADAFATAEHPEFLDFEVTAIYREAIPTLKHTGVSKYETAGRPTCTDESILGRGSY